jgi:hypothetical protein
MAEVKSGGILMCCLMLKPFILSDSFLTEEEEDEEERERQTDRQKDIISRLTFM